MCPRKNQQGTHTCKGAFKGETPSVISSLAFWAAANVAVNVGGVVSRSESLVAAMGWRRAKEKGGGKDGELSEPGAFFQKNPPSFCRFSGCLDPGGPRVTNPR